MLILFLCHLRSCSLPYKFIFYHMQSLSCSLKIVNSGQAVLNARVILPSSGHLAMFGGIFCY